MAVVKKLSVQERIERAEKKKEEAEKELALLKSAGFWEKNADVIKDFWKNQIKEHNSQLSDLRLLEAFIKTVGMRGIQVVKKPTKPSKPKKPATE